MSEQRSETLSDTQAELRRERTAMWRSFNKQVQEQPILYGVIFVLIGLLAGGLLFHYEPDWEANNLFSFLTNFATEALGVLVTIAIVNAWQDRRAQERLKKELLSDVKYGTNDDARRAINRMRNFDLLTSENGVLSKRFLWGLTLNKVYLASANLSETHLERANLTSLDMYKADMSKANLHTSEIKQSQLNWANLSKADLRKATIEDSSLWGTNLESANMEKTVLKRCSLGEANLSYASLKGADLRNLTLIQTDLTNANLLDAKLTNLQVYDSVVLPNGLPYDPAQGPEQLERFTNPDHPEFWDPCKERSERPWYCKDQSTDAP